MKAFPSLAPFLAFLAVLAFASSAAASIPTVSIKAGSSSISAGQSDTLTVTETSAASIHVTGSDGSSYNLPYSGGTITVKPASTTTYTATATNSSGSATAQTTITVGASGSGSGPTVSITASSSSISAGQSDTLTVTESKAASIHVTGTNGTSYNLPYSGGTISVAPSSTTTYTATATNSSGSATAQTTITVSSAGPTVTITAKNSSISQGSSDTLTVTATNASSVAVSGSDGSSYTLPSTGGTVTVTPTMTTTYTAEAMNSAGAVASAQTTVTVGSATGLSSIAHVIFMLQENHSFDDYFGMLNPYRHANGWDIGSDGKTYEVDGIDDKLATISNDDDEGDVYHLYKFRTTCIDNDSSDWLSSYGDVYRWNFSTTRPIRMDGFVHTAEGFAKSCLASGKCGGAYTDTTGERAMGYYDQDFLNYYYYMASQFAVSDRWFSPVSSKSIPNRIATFTGGTTQGLVHDPGNNDHLPQLNINNIFEELDNAGVSWKIYYTVTNGGCIAGQSCPSGTNPYPETTFSNLSYSYRYMYNNPSHAACTSPTEASSVVGDSTNSFCIDPNRIAPLSQYYTDVKNNTLPKFAFIESGSGTNDEHPGSEQSILTGQAEVAKIVNALMVSPSWGSSVFFFSYDEGGGPYDHVPPVPGYSNENTDSSLGTIPDISGIAVNPDAYNPCVPSGGTPTTHCDLYSNDPGAHSTDAAAQYGFAAQLGFRVPNIVISPFTRKHYVSHVPMDHTAIIKFVENRFIGSSAHLTARDAAQPNLLNFFDFSGKPWATPPTPPTPASPTSLGYNPCLPQDMGP
ncbi:MAG TPA: alkaline phosphatase family protein [Terracidiphilus sp.]|nr:alkaline phosphatase family protein [Terracidiphilus sp.]